MIYTVTFSPSLDYVMYVPNLELGKVSRSEREYLYPGGKGINVSLMLSTLGIENIALGYTAGFTGDQLTNMLRDLHCQTDFTRLPEGNTRINVKLKAGKESDINGQGPNITHEALEILFQKLGQLKEGDFLLLAGTIPFTLPQNSYESILTRLDGKGIHFVVDATKDLLKKSLRHRPFLIKPNSHELGEMFGKELHTTEDIISCAREAQQLGARNVLVSLAEKGALLLTEDGRTLTAQPPSGTAVNSVGAGDSMVAGFLTGWLNTGDYEKAFQLAVVTGSASAYQEWLATKDQVVAFLQSPEDYGLL